MEIESGPLFTSDQLSRAKTDWEPTFRLLDEDVEAPGFRSVVSAFLEALNRRSVNHAIQLERESLCCTFATKNMISKLNLWKRATSTFSWLG